MLSGFAVQPGIIERYCGPRCQPFDKRDIEIFERPGFITFQGQNTHDLATLSAPRILSFLEGAVAQLPLARDHVGQFIQRLHVFVGALADYRRALGLSQNNLAVLLHSTGGVKESEELYRTALKLRRQLADDFPEELTDHALPYFIDWLIENVHLVEITAYSDADAYTIFETMNDRGLSLTPTDMLKGYLLANIDEAKRTAANTRWRDRIRELNDAGKEVESDCFKAWLRSQHATKIRERKRGAKQPRCWGTVS